MSELKLILMLISPTRLTALCTSCKRDKEADGLNESGGNLHGIGIEMCINPENDYEQTLKNTAKLTAVLVKAYHLDLGSVKKHQDFSGKECSTRLIRAGRWQEFLDSVEQEM